MLWRAEQDLKTSLELFGEQIQALHGKPSIKFAPLYAKLKEIFTADDIDELCGQMGYDSKSKKIIFNWKERGAIDKVGRKKYRKILKYNG